ncbi:hypothetical protein HAX54_012487, partial [Datura stramonium]|nr:hypothetical protein [Datura stramonium]
MNPNAVRGRVQRVVGSARCFMTRELYEICPEPTRGCTDRGLIEPIIICGRQRKLREFHRKNGGNQQKDQCSVVCYHDPLDGSL